jgi:hypothetical protein
MSYIFGPYKIKYIVDFDSGAESDNDFFTRFVNLSLIMPWSGIEVQNYLYKNAKRSMFGHLKIKNEHRIYYYHYLINTLNKLNWTATDDLKVKVIEVYEEGKKELNSGGSFSFL